jgi:hypothetical protein
MNDQDIMDMIWLRRICIGFSVLIYILIGLYWFYPEILNMLFWPFHYGWFAH